MSAAHEPFRLAVVPGTTPGKWLRIWRERYERPIELITVSGRETGSILTALPRADAALVRLPETHSDGERIRHAIPLYEEDTVAVFAKDHFMAAAGPELAWEDVCAAALILPQDDAIPWPADQAAIRSATRAADAAAGVELALTGFGVLILPRSVARAQNSKEIRMQTIADAPRATMHLIWDAACPPEGIEEFVGIVRGRTAHSSRTPTPPGKHPAKTAPRPPEPAKRAKSAKPTQQQRARKQSSRRKPGKKG